VFLPTQEGERECITKRGVQNVLGYHRLLWLKNAVWIDMCEHIVMRGIYYSVGHCRQLSAVAQHT
jgi:hypothetical protein